MAVSMFQNSYRADFMISDAAMPQRLAEMAQMDEAQQAQFAKVLSDFSNSSSEQPMISEAETLTRVDKSMLLPDNPRDIAKKILKGDLEIKDVPADMLIPVLKELAVLQKLESFDEDEEESEDGKDDSEDDVLTFNPAQAAVFEQTYAASIQEQIMMLLYRFIEAHNEREAEDKVTMLDGISEPIPEYPGFQEALSFPVVVLKEKIEDSDFAELIDNIVESVKEEQTRANTDVFVKSDQPEQTSEYEVVEVLRKAAKNGEIEKPVVKTVSEEKPEEEDEKAAVEPTKPEERVDRSNAISEELQMLKNAKLARNAKSEETAEEPVKPTAAANPLDTDTPIVLTGKDGQEIKVRPSDIVAQATKLVEQAVSENKEQTEYSLVLNPEELGKITVKLTKAADGAISVTIAAESARTQRILEQNSSLMQSNLRSNGVQLESWQTVNESQQETLAQDYNGSSKNPSYRDDNRTEEEDPDEKSFAEIIAAM